MMPTQVSKGPKIPRLDIATTQEEADLIITQQAIHLAKEDGESRVCVLYDDTDVFALLVYLLSREQLQSFMTMESPIHGCDSVAATYGLGKTKAITVARKGYTLDLLGQPMADIDKVVKQATVFIAACYGLKTPCSSMTDCRQHQWAQKIGKSSAAQKLCSLPPTTEEFEQNVRRAHHQVALWYSALGGVPPAMNAIEYGWESDDTNR